MIQHVPATARHYQDFGWLKTYWLFSFDTYHDPSNLRWGVLRVFNDDVVESGQGFGMHPHREMEIVTIVHTGELTHEDSTGGKGLIRAGEVQRMSAGTGLMHSEFNYGKEPVSLYQIWILPNQRGVQPGYEQKSVGTQQPNSLTALASGEGVPGGLIMNADATIYVGNLKEGKRLDYKTDSARRVFIYVRKGNLSVNSVGVRTGDQVRIKNEGKLMLDGIADSEFVLIDAGVAL
jgi:redox-sensitive bicupin YhaK (pirin superfamily)